MATEAPSASGIGGTLKKKAGPLPVWAWTLLGIVVFAYYLHRKKSAAAAQAAAAQQPQPNSGANLGSNTLSNLVPTAYPMPYSGGDTFVNITDTGGTTQTPPTKTPTPPGNSQGGKTGYVWAKGDTWDSVGKKLNIAPVLLWEKNGAPAGFKAPNPGTQIDIQGLYGNSSAAYANQEKIVAAEGAIAKSGKPPAPAQGTVF